MASAFDMFDQDLAPHMHKLERGRLNLMNYVTCFIVICGYDMTCKGSIRCIKSYWVASVMDLLIFVGLILQQCTVAPMPTKYIVILRDIRKTYRCQTTTKYNKA